MFEIVDKINYLTFLFQSHSVHTILIGSNEFLSLSSLMDFYR